MKCSLIYLVVVAVFAACECNAASFMTKQDQQQKQRKSFPRLLDNRIVGGHDTDISVYPHQLSLRWKNNLTPERPYSHICGCSLVKPNVAVTAAHCVLGDVASQLQVIGGSSTLNSNDGYILPVKDIIIHEDYDPPSFNNDVAVLILGASFPINNFTVGTVELATHPSREGVMSVVTGWGTTNSGGQLATQLQAVQVPVVSNENCALDYDEEEITDGMLCAGYRGVGGKDACQGDSGGPLIVNGRLAGIVSWGYGCALPSYPGVYANVTHYLPWLSQKIALAQEN